MCARFLQLARPADVRRFVKTRAQLDQRGHLLSGVGGFDQSLHDGRVAAGAIERDFDGEHLRIGRGDFDEVDDRIEAFIRMVQQDILFADDFENIGRRRQRRIGGGLKRPIF